MRISKKNALISLALAAAMLGGVIAGVLVSKNIYTSLRIKKTATIGVYDIDHVTALTSITFGDMFWNEQWGYPSTINVTDGNWARMLSANTYEVADIDQADFWVKFSVSALPQGVRFYINCWQANETNTQTWVDISADGQPQGYVTVFQLYSPSLHPSANHAAYFQIILYTVGDESPPFGTFSPVLNIAGVTTSSG
jgi:hypothetical protein